MNGSVDDEQEGAVNADAFKSSNKATLDARILDIKQAEEALGISQAAVHFSKERMRKFIGKTLGIPHEYIEIGSWACENSPTKECFYDRRDSSCFDFCLICGNPHERK